MKKDDYSDWSKEDLLKEIKKLKDLTRFGIVWDEEKTKEKFDKESENKLPILKQVKTKELQSDKNLPTNILIEGDNLHALSVLNYTHEKEIDVIYIDPPYNTGNNTWKYNNKFNKKDDPYRHSNWLSFMNNRLKHARRLLKKTGIILVTIDDYEIHNLRGLMDKIFKEDNRLGTISIQHNPRGRSDDKFIATSNEYMLIYGKKIEFSKINKLELTEEQKEEFPLTDDISNYRLLSFQRSGSNSRRRDRPNLFYPIYYNPKTNEITLEKEKDFVEIIPKDSDGMERVWRWGKNTFETRKQTEIIIKPSKNSFSIHTKDRIKSGRKAKTIWTDPKYDASSHGTILLKKILSKNKSFEFPKSLYAVMDALSISSEHDSVILDFFAGSGTTGHAVLELNKQDGGNRKFILCTNNEGNICTDVCYPRMKNVMRGYVSPKKEKIKGLNGNLKYFKTDFVDADPTDKNKKKLVEQSTEMLCLREDCFEEIKQTKTYSIFKNHEEKHLGIIYDDNGIEPLKKQIKSLGKKFNVYVFSLDDSVREEEFEDVMDLIDLKSIPQAILNVHRRIFK